MNLGKDKKEIERERQGRLFLLRSIAIVGIAIGLVLLARGWGLSLQTNGFVSEGTTIKRNPLPINTVLSISGLTIPKSGGEKSSWAKDISSYFGLPTTQGFWLLQTKNQSHVLAEFLPTKTEAVLNIPKDLIQTKFFKNGQFLGLTAYSVSQPQQLLATNPTDAKSLVQLFEFPNNYLVSSVYLAPIYQEVYYSLKERYQNNYQIRVIRPNGDEINVYNSNYYQINKILNVNVAKGYLDFTATLPNQNASQPVSGLQSQNFDNSTSLCFRLMLQNNSVSEIVCGAVNLDGFNQGYGVVENADNNQEIFGYDYETLQPQMTFAANQGDKLSLLARFGDYLLWQAQDLAGSKSVYVYNLPRREIRSLNNLPTAAAVQLWMLEDKVVIIGQTSLDTYRIFVESEIQPATSTSSQSSATTQASTTSEISTSSNASNASSTSEVSLTSTVSSQTSQTSPNDLAFTKEETSGWSMYTFGSCLQNCRLQILTY